MKPKYRIVYNDSKYFPQIKNFIFWKIFLQFNKKPCRRKINDAGIISFYTLREAKNFIYDYDIKYIIKAKKPKPLVVWIYSIKDKQ